MLRILREHASSWMLKAILILVAISFVLFFGGYAYFKDKKETYAAKVNGVVIELKEYEEAYQGLIKQYRETLGSSYSDKMIEELQLKRKLLDEFISKVLMIQEGVRLGLVVHDAELKGMIESTPSFQVDGQFSQRHYERFLRLNRMSAEQFERMQREHILTAKVKSLIKLNAGKVSEEELLDTYLYENERLSLTFLKVISEAFKGQVSINELEIKDYYQKHQEEFRVPIFCQIQYLLFRPSDFEEKIQVSPDEIKRYYELQKEKFKIPKRIKLREILIKLSAEETPNQMEEMKKKVEEILEKAKKVKDFGSLAKQYSESNTASKGGEIGWVQRGTMDESFERILFTMKLGEISRPIRGKEGIQIFKIEGVEEEKIKSIEEVKNQIFLTLKKEKAKTEASRKADDAFYSLFRSRDLEGLAKEKGIPIKTTNFFKEGDEIPEVGKTPTFYSSAFSLKMGEISPVVNIPPNFYILKLVDRKESRIPPLEEVKEEVKRKIIGVKCDERARQVAEDLLNQVQKRKSIKEIAKEKRYPVEETGFFTRAAGMIPKLGPSGELANILSSMTEKNPYPKTVLRTKDGYFVVGLSALEPADQNKFSSVRKEIEKRLTYQKQEDFFQNWITQLRAKSKVEINKEFL